MSKKINKCIALLLSSVIISSFSYADEHEKHTDTYDKVGVQALSSNLKGLLSQEMLALQKGMMSLIPDIVAGNWESIEATAKQIEGSYILKQKLTKEQVNELHSKLSTSFIELDQSFHKDAGMLAHVAKNKNAELVNFYFYKMNNACTNCHSKFATHRFSAFKMDKKRIEDEHSEHHNH